ncbi:hypothetical protein MPLB_1500005 [Mesorhizobium sp. ORS 3324]|nr:hypothetical protein MPLB_1500005 [Mesorhizobium sp. ORS 3324]
MLGEARTPAYNLSPFSQFVRFAAPCWSKQSLVLAEAISRKHISYFAWRHLMLERFNVFKQKRLSSADLVRQGPLKLH